MTHKWIPTKLATLNMIFSVTYYLELHNDITIYFMSHFLSINVNWLFEYYRTLISLLGKDIAIIVKRYSTMFFQIASDIKYHI